jgi:hypothetical protein
MSNDEAPLTFVQHKRNTVLGASLVLEAILPELTTEQINRASPLLAKEFDNYKT